MKKLASILALLALIFALASCGGNEEPAKTTGSKWNGEGFAGDIFS